MELNEARELLIGTWIGIALLADALIERRILSKREFMLLLSQTEEASSDNRRTALAGLRLLISRGFRCTPQSIPAKSRDARRYSRPTGCRRPSSSYTVNARSHQIVTTGAFCTYIDIDPDQET
jgi:hypothetical protein